MKYVIWYCKITKNKEIGVVVNYPFFGGEASSQTEVDAKARELVNDKNRQGTIIPMVLKQMPGQSMLVPKDAATRRFKRMAEDIYQSEELYNRRNKRV